MWSGLKLTENGKQALISAQLSNVLNIKSIVIGDGVAPADYHKCNELVHQLYELTDLKVDTVTEGCQITVDFPNVDYDYYFREIGVIVTTDSGDVLYVYDNAGDDAQCIHAENTAGKIQKRLRLVLAISDVKNITISKTSPLYVDYDEFTKHTSDAEHHTTVQEKTKWNNMLSEAKEYSDATYQQAAGYTDKKIADLIGGAPETLDTLEEVATAIKENEDVVKALDAAIGKKANQSELDTHTGNDTIHITAAERKQWNGYKEQITNLNSDLNEKNTIEITTLTPSVDISLASSERKIIQLTWDAPSNAVLIGLWINTNNSNITVTLRNAANGAANIKVINDMSQDVDVVIQIVLNYATIS